MVIRRLLVLFALLAIAGLLSACRSVPAVDVTYDPASLQFSGERALELVDTFVTQFPDRASGMPNAEPAARWLLEQFEGLGLTCVTDEWEVINFSEPLPLRNVVCELPGTSEEEIVLMAHHDQSPQTVFGADNDGSGIGILLHLAELFAAEEPGRSTLVFLASDGEEYGMLGSLRYVEQHPDPERIVAGVSLDNVGKEFYDGLDMSPIGQFDGYGPAWLLLAARDSAGAAAAAGDRSVWVPQIRAPFDQIIDQAVPISFMDQGPLVAAGVPAFGFAGIAPAEFAESHYETYHSPGDTMEIQSAATLTGVGRSTEALVRHLQTQASLPGASGPYLLFAESDNVLSGPLLWLIFGLFTLLFFAAALWLGRRSQDGLFAGWRTALPHFLGLWIPMVLAVLSLYAMTAVGLLQRFDRYFAVPKHPAYTNPRWPAVIIFLVGLVVFFYLGRRLAGRFQRGRPDFLSVKSLAILAVALALLYITIFNPFSLLIAVPLVFWLLITGRRGPAFGLDLLFFVLGSALLVYLLYTFGFAILRIDWYILWYVLMMMAVPMVGFFTMAVITAIVAAGLSLVVRPPAVTTAPATQQAFGEAAVEP